MTDRIYVAKPAPGPIESSLKTADTMTRLRRRATQHFMLDVSGRSFTVGAVTIVVDRRALMQAKSPSGVVHFLRVVLDAFDANGDRVLGPSLDDRTFDFVNPPSTVHDGTWRKVTTDLTREYPNLKEDVAAAFRQMVGRAVVQEATRIGKL